MFPSARFRDLLADRKMSQSELARRVGVSQTTIAKLARGTGYGSKHLHRIARELRTTPAYLEGETDDPDDGVVPAADLDSVSRELIDNLATMTPARSSRVATNLAVDGGGRGRFGDCPLAVRARLPGGGRAAMIGLLFASMLFQSDWVSPLAQDIPREYRGTWALARDLCVEKDKGPAFATIGARHIYFYERSGFLNLAQLNFAPDVPSFYGEFSFVHNLEFSHEVIRLDMRGDRLFVSENYAPDARPSSAAWYRCNDDQGAK